MLFRVVCGRKHPVRALQLAQWEVFDLRILLGCGESNQILNTGRKAAGSAGDKV